MRAIGLFLLMLLVGCGGTRRPVVVSGDPETVAVKSRSAYVPPTGATRAEVENILGEPTHQSITKAGQVQAMYEVQRARYRSVVYTDRGRVAYVIPAQPFEPINLKYED